MAPKRQCQINGSWNVSPKGATRGETRTLNAHDGRVQKRKAAYPAHNSTVRGLPLNGQKEGQTLIRNSSGGTHASRGGEHKRTEMCVFNLTNSLFVRWALHAFMLAVRVRLI